MSVRGGRHALLETAGLCRFPWDPPPCCHERAEPLELGVPISTLTSGRSEDFDQHARQGSWLQKPANSWTRCVVGFSTGVRMVAKLWLLLEVTGE